MSAVEALVWRYESLVSINRSYRNGSHDASLGLRAERLEVADLRHGNCCWTGS